MIIIAGLGNPGKKYQNTRHNIGFQIIDEFAGKNEFPDFQISKKSNSLISEKNWAGKKIILAKPQTFMNESGRSIKALINFYKIPKTNLIIVHDDIDLPLGKIKTGKSRGSAGHKGVESVIKEIGTKNFIRLRTGIKPVDKKPKNTEKFVLEKFGKEESKILQAVISEAVQVLKNLIFQEI